MEPISNLSKNKKGVVGPSGSLKGQHGRGNIGRKERDDRTDFR